jgi:hypothetical protein
MSAVWEVPPRGETDDEHRARMEAKSARRGELYASYRAARESQRRPVKAPPAEKKCPECPNMFISTQPHRVYCSAGCKRKAEKRRASGQGSDD